MSISYLLPEGVRQAMVGAAEAEGLHFIGAAGLDVGHDHSRYIKWLDEGRHGSMTWMENHLDVRAKPERLLVGAKMALVFGFQYYQGDTWSRGKKDPAPRIAQYARLRDYHKFLRSKLERVQSSLEKLSTDTHVWRITVDSAPLLERALAAGSGGAFIGKNTCAIHPHKGSFFLLGEILTSWDLGLPTRRPPATQHHERTSSGGCGSCRRCQVHCPTGALDKDYQIDARKCLSYWTIEHRGEIPLDYWPWVGRYMFGCDICQLVCPYNRGLEISADSISLRKISETPKLIDIVLMSQEAYESMFGGTPMTRAKRSGLRRNALIAGVVTADRAVLDALDQLTKDADAVICATANQGKLFLVKQQNPAI